MENKNSKIKSFISGKGFIISVAVISILLSFGTIFKGFDIDDYIQRVYVLGSDKLQDRGIKQADGNPSFSDVTLHYFTFFDPKELDQIQSMKEYGNVPWWFNEKAQLSFLRPITSMTHWLDYKLWPDSPEMMHVHNLFWATLLVISIALVYRRFLGAGVVTALATFLYIIDTSRFRPIEWIANRNALIATFFGFVVLILHDKWRKGEGKKYAYLAPIALAISVLSAEAGIGTMAFICAYAFFIEDKDWKSKILSIVPYFGVIVLWRVIYKILEYGALHTRMYIDPVKDPLEFLTALFERAPILISGQFLGFDNFAMSLSLPATKMMIIICIIFIVLLLALFFPLLKRDKTARFWCAAMFMAVVPVCAYGVQQGRLLSFASIGGAGLVAQFLVSIIQNKNYKGIEIVKAFYYKKLEDLLEIVISYKRYHLFAYKLLVSIIKTPIFLINAVNHIRKMLVNDFYDSCLTTYNNIVLFFSLFLGLFLIALEVVKKFLFIIIVLFIMITTDENSSEPVVNEPRINVGFEDEIEQKTVVVVNAPDAFRFVYLPFERDYHNQPIPEKIRILSTSISPIKVKRISDNALLITPEAGFLPDTTKPIPGAPENLPDNHAAHTIHKIIQGYRDERNPMKVGEKVVFTDMTVEITAITDNGLPTEAKFIFNKSLDDDSFKWIYCDWPLVYKVLAGQDVSYLPGVIKNSAFKKFDVPAIGEEVTILGPFYDLRKL